VIKMKPSIVSLSVLLMLSFQACSHQAVSPVQAEMSSQDANQETISQTKTPIAEPTAGMTTIKGKKITLVCSAPPPLKDTTKLKQNLLEKGYINAQMTEQEADAKVDEYIYQRQQAFKNCNKGQ
jgi:hypothetical protein